MNAARRLTGLAWAAFAAFASGGACAAEPQPELRVCADPDNLPFSNRQLEGFENRIATLVAQDLNATLRYTWHPQRKGFVRQTLKAGECDLMVGVPAGYDAVLATRPYYTSTYVFVVAAGQPLELRTLDDPGLRELKIGVHASRQDHRCGRVRRNRRGDGLGALRRVLRAAPAGAAEAGRDRARRRRVTDAVHL